MHKSDRTAAGCTVEDEPYKLLERDAEKSILAGPLRFPPGQLPFSTSLKAPVPFTHDAVTVPVMFGQTEHNWVYQAVWRSLRRLHRQWSTFWWEVLHAVERENGCFIENYHRYYIFRIAI